MSGTRKWTVAIFSTPLGGSRDTFMTLI